MWNRFIFPAIVGLALWMFMVWFSLKLIEDYKIKKQRRGYKEEDDIGRIKEKNGSQGRIRSSNKRDSNTKRGKREIQNVIKHAKRELLSD